MACGSHEKGRLPQLQCEQPSHLMQAVCVRTSEDWTAVSSTLDDV